MSRGRRGVRGASGIVVDDVACTMPPLVNYTTVLERGCPFCLSTLLITKLSLQKGVAT